MRYTALKILEDVLTDGKYSNLELVSGLDKLEEKDRALATNIIYGVLQNKMRLDYIIAAYSKMPVKKISSDIMNILRMGIYQALFMDKIPPYAITNESIKLVKKCRKVSASGFVNAVLRGVLRNDKEIKYPEDRLEYLSIYYSCPLWIVKMWDKMYPEKVEDLLKAMNSKPEFSVRVNTLKISVSEFIKLKGGRKSDVQKDVVVLPSGCDVKNDDLFKKGFYYPQDTASALVSEVLSPKKGQTVLDLCAAPGGKTTHIAQIMENEGEIFAFDIYEHKLEIIKNTADRLGVKIIHTELGDALKLNEKFILAADCVLVDAPCSGLGIMRRKPEIRYMKTREDLSELAEIQGKILNNAAKYVKKGGTLLYSTCTISDVENSAVTERFLNENEDYSLSEKPLQLLPCDSGTDGFYIAKFIKR